MVPHAGYVYSGAIAGQTFASIDPAARVLCMGPNHTGSGKARALFPGRSFLLPGGAVLTDRTLNGALASRALVDWDDAAHAREHSIEVELPFLAAHNPAVLVSALCLAGLSLAECRALGREIASVIADLSPRPLLVASSDMSHYVSADDARRLDGLALSRILALDPEGLYDTVREYDISMCGFVPTTVMLFAAKALGAKSAELVRYGNSGERSGDWHSVVGYAGVIVE